MQNPFSERRSFGEDSNVEGYRLTYHVDMVFCIDATGSMRHVLDFVK